MSVNASGMNIVIELGYGILDQLMEKVLVLQLPLIRPVGYTRFDVIPSASATAYWPELPVVGGGTPDMMIVTGLKFISETTDGRVFRYGWEDGENLGLFCQAIPEVRDDGVCVKLYYRGVGQMDGGMSIIDLGPEIDLLRDELSHSPLSLGFEIPFWGRPEPFVAPQLLRAHLTLPQPQPGGGLGALAIGIEVEGGSETSRATFVGNLASGGIPWLQSILDIVSDDVTDPSMAIAIEGEIIESYIPRLLQEEVLNRLASHNIFHGSIEEVGLNEHSFNVFSISYSVTLQGELHLVEAGPWSGDWDVEVSYDFFSAGLAWGGHLLEFFCDDPDLQSYLNEQRWDAPPGSIGAVLNSSFEVDSQFGPRYCAMLPEIVQIEWHGPFYLSDNPRSRGYVYDATIVELGTPEINVIAEPPPSIDLAIRLTNPGCKAFTEQEGNTEAWFTIQNTGDGPLKLRVTAEPEDVFVASAQSETLLTGETGVRVALRSFAAGKRSGVVRIIHNAPNEGDIEIPVEATVTHTFDDVNAVVSNDFRSVICSWADLVQIARGFPWWRSFFEELPIDIDKPYPCLEVFDLGLRDSDDDYRLIARTEAGELLAEVSTHTSFKRLYLPVDRDATLSLEVQFRNQPGAKAQEPFFFKMRKQTVQMISSFALEGSRTAAAFEGGLCVTSEAGLTVVDTIDPWRPLVTARLEEVGSLTAVSAFRSHVFAVGEKGLFLIDLSDFKKPKQLYLMEDMAGAFAVRHWGRHLWIVRQNQINVFEITKEYKLNLLAKTQFDANALDFAVCPRLGVVLDKRGLLIFELQGTTLSLVGKQSVDNAGSVSLSTHGALLCLTDAKTGTHMLDISQPKSPEAVAHYVQPFWRSGLVMNFSRNLAYKMSAKGNGFDIFLFHTNKVMRQ